MEKGVNVWVRDTDRDEWHRAQVVAMTAGESAAHQQITVRFQDGPLARTERQVLVDVAALESEAASDVLVANSHDMDLVEDLIQLPHLHEPGICHTLNERFKINEIYTLTGEILLAINPFKNIGIYTDKIMRKYIRHGDKRALGSELVDMPPHVFSVADKAYRSLMNPLATNAWGNANQSILVSGESGAGKTESTKFVMQYLATISQNRKHDANDGSFSGAPAPPSPGEDDGAVMKQVMSSNPILESFGNARTIRNDNSSRFGKFIKMQFSDRGRLVGATIQTYLLEKVRLTYQAEAERNYHVFYEIVAGASAVEKQRWQLTTPTQFHYLNQSTCVQRKDGVDDAQQFRVLKNAMAVMGFEEQDLESIFATVAMLLHLGNFEFDASDHGGSGVDGSTIAPDCSDSMQFVLGFLEVDKAGLEQAICFRKIQAKEETYSISLAPDAAENSRDALARFLYGKLFDWLVARINDMMAASTKALAHGRGGFIGLLDIFGFEDLAHNSFEQLCINYANETLQQHFNLTVLRLEQEVYERERIQWSFINFPDNSMCIELIEGRPFGLLTALDEECIVPQGNDRNFARKLYRQHKDHAHFSADKTEVANHVFVIHHYAGRVAYDTFGFCEKNKDVLYPEITDLLKNSSKPFVRGLLQAEAVVAVRQQAPPMLQRKASRAVSSRLSLGSQFRTQLKELIETIGVTSCHYVRCLKPNDLAQPATFSSKRVCDQLKAGGVLEAVRVNRAGYPVRLTHQQFIKRYRPLANGAILRAMPEAASTDEHFDADKRKECCQLLVTFLLQAHRDRHPEKYTETSATAVSHSSSSNKLDPFAVAGIQVGLTKVFFRRAAIQFVEAQLAKRYGEFVVLIQAVVRGFIGRRRFQHMQKACGVLQRIVRGHLARCRFFDMRERYRQQLERDRAASAAAEAAERKADAKRAAKAKAAAAAAAAEAAAEAKAAADAKAEADRKAAEEEAARTTTSSDPVSDDSSEGDGDGSDIVGLRLTDRPTARMTNGRGTARFRFTKDYSNDRETNRMTVGDGQAPRSVAMDPGDTVLHVAANCCNEHDVLKLLQNGSDINARNRRGRTPLHTAALHHNLEVVGILLDWEADVVCQDNDGNTPLHLTTDANIARMLLEAGCTPNIINADGRTPLIEAVDRGDTQIVKFLMQFKADVLFRELKHHQTALHLAVRKGHYAIVMELCKTEDVGDLIKLTDRNENNALHFAVSRDRKNGPRLVDYLIKHGAEVNKVNARLQTPLVVHIMTTRQTDPSITELFLMKGADPNVALADGSSLLHVSVERELIDIACSLLRSGSNLNQPDDKGRLVMEVCPKKFLRKLFSAISHPPQWIDDKSRRACMSCNNNFKFGSRKHHCRHCGCVCCSDCSAFTIEMFRFPKDFPGRVTSGGKSVKDPQRVCKACNAVFKLRSAQKESKSGFIARVLGYEWDEVTSHQN